MNTDDHLSDVDLDGPDCVLDDSDFRLLEEETADPNDEDTGLGNL